MNNQLKYFRGIIAIGIIAAMLSIGQVFAQSYLPTKIPDRIVLNPTEDPTISMAVTWRTNTSVTTHYPFYSTKANRDNPRLRKHFQSILEKYDVDMVLTGHDHAYGRGTKTIEL